MKAKIWLISWVTVVFSVLSIVAFEVYKIDPFFHYHKPDLDNYYYQLNNQRSQNDGICKNFDYDAIITGTSMTENFRTSEADSIFGCKAIKVPFSGGYYKEINDNIDRGLKANKKCNLVIRCLDMSMFMTKWDDRRTDLGEFPEYLYDSNPFNDVKYLLNRDIIFSRAYQMTLDNDIDSFEPGIMSFDAYSRWQASFIFGIKTVKPEGLTNTIPNEGYHITEADKEIIKENIEYNIIRTADENPDVDFYYFYSPYSIVWWSYLYNNGSIYKQLEAEAYVTELILPHKNIHLFSFNNRTDIITDLNNYKDHIHYGTWINSLILRWMFDGKYQLTEENYKEYLRQEFEFYTTFDYVSINNQVDYESDLYAAALLNRELTGAEPLDVLNDEDIDVILNFSEYIKDENERNRIIDCHGTLKRDYAKDDLVSYIRDKEFIGAKFSVNLDDGYNFLAFKGQKIADHGRLTAYAYNEEGKLVSKVEINYDSLDNDIHQYVLDLSTIKGDVTVVLNGGYVDMSGSGDSEYCFSDIYLY